MTTDDDALATDNDADASSAVGATAVAEAEEPKAKPKIAIDVVVEQIGSCKKHVRITVPRGEIDKIFGDQVGKLVSEAEVPGFRVGHVPPRLVEKRFRKELDEEVKRTLLMDSLEQLEERDDLDPIGQPDLEVDDIEVPEEGDFEYEFDIEVRPEFDLPEYAGLKIRRPVKKVTEEQVDRFLDRYLAQYGETEECMGGAQAGDLVTVSIEMMHDDKSLQKISSVVIPVRPSLQFADAELPGFDKLMSGAVVGDVREADVTVSTEAESIEMRGESVHAAFKVKRVLRIKPPVLNSALLNRLGVESKEELREEIGEMLERQATYQQRQAVREQVTDKITESADWDLPEKLVLSQVENALRREILEMQQAGFTSGEIQARQNELRQRAVSTTRTALKEHFVLDKIADEEKIKVTPEDIDAEIKVMAVQRGESPRRVRAKLKKSGMIENLDAQIRERKAVDVILERAQFEDYEPDEVDPGRVAALSYSVCGTDVEAESDEADEETPAGTEE